MSGILLACVSSQAQLQIPASTAYLEPDMEGARVSRRGITGWPDSKQTVLWFGKFNKPGELDVAMSLKLPPDKPLRLRFTLDDQSKETVAKGAPTNLLVNFGTFKISSAGYRRFKLECLDDSGHADAQVDSLILSGPATEGAHFNMQARRNAASVHLMYPTGADSKVEACYCEARALEDPVGTFYMACGFHRGYFGMQINSATERRIIFSVWDSGKEPVDRKNVAAEDQVQLVSKGEGVVADGFGNEGTGGHSHEVVAWKTGDVQRFVVTAKPSDATHTIYAGYYFRPDRKQWALIAAWKAPKDGGRLRQLHSFSEDFRGENGQLRRKALFGNQWMRTSDGEWHELTTASFSHDATGSADRLDRFMGVEDGQFFLSHGGFVDGFTRFGEKFSRPAVGIAPRLSLPELPKMAATSSTP
jgi:hypothetical protein